MLKKIPLSLTLFVLFAFGMVSNAFAATGYWTIYYNGSDEGSTEGWTEIHRASDNSVLAKATTKVYSGDLYYVKGDNGVYVSVSANIHDGIRDNFVGSNYDYAPDWGTAITFVDMGKYTNGVTYKSYSTHYVYNIDGVKTGYGNLNSSGISF